MFFVSVGCVSVITYGPKKINLSGITLANSNRSGPTFMYMHMKMGDDVRKISGAIDPAATKWGPPTSLAQPVFFVRQTRHFRQLSNG